MQILRNLSEHLRQEANRTILLQASTDMELYDYVHAIEDTIGKSLSN